MSNFKKAVALVQAITLISFPFSNALAHDHHHDDNRDEHRHHNKFNYNDNSDSDDDAEAELVEFGVIAVAAGVIYIGKSIGSVFSHSPKKPKQPKPNPQPEYYHTLPTTNNYLETPNSNGQPVEINTMPWLKN